MEEKEYKVTVSARVYPELKEKISASAFYEDRTLSSQVEHMLDSYYAGVGTESYDSEEPEEDYTEEISNLEDELEETKAQNESLHETNTALLERIEELETLTTKQQGQIQEQDSELEELTSENQTLRNTPPPKAHELLANENGLFFRFFTNLRRKYPELTAEQIIVAAVACCSENERSRFTNHNLGSYLRSYPNFLTPENDAA